MALPVHAAPYSVTDDTQHATRFEQPPQRIVTLLPSLAETVCALGACNRIVGVDRYTVWPAQLQRVAQVGGGLDPNIEAIVALKPDVVLLSASSRASERLRALGLRVVVLEPQTHTQVHAVLGQVAQVLALPPSAAEQLWQHIQADIQRSAASLPPALRGKRVYFEVNSGPYAAGETSFIGETMAQLGLQNIVPKTLGPFPKLNPEWVVQKNPDYILSGERSTAEMLRYPGWGRLAAVRAGHVCVFAPAQSDVLIHPGPRMGEAAALIVQCLKGQLQQTAAPKP